MLTQGEVESAICKGMAQFEQEYMGRGPKDLRAHLLGDLLVVRLVGVLTAAEQHLVRTLPLEKGRDLLKQVRTQLIELARPRLADLVRQVTGVEIRSLHHDISTVTAKSLSCSRSSLRRTCGSRGSADRHLAVSSKSTADQKTAGPSGAEAPWTHTPDRRRGLSLQSNCVPEKRCE